ncbi:MAG: FAD-dependent oxidoreductase, partial [Mariprofundaceae bacterium]|nr:FAD-dependent oxidoreductase [Mariprofundaceae bacterium]
MKKNYLTSRADLTQHDAGTGAKRSRIPVYMDFLTPCNHACPAGEDIQAWLALAQEGQYEAAWQKLIEDNPFPAIHGRVCYHPCETSCNRAYTDKEVSIHAVERFLGDMAMEKNWQAEFATPPGGKKVLVIGGGPSGLSAAYHLTRMGHEVEIREAGPVAGGMIHFGIPAYRMPRKELQQEIKRIEDMGVKITLNHRVGDVLQEKADGSFAAVFIAIGAHLGKKIDIPSRDAGKMLDAVSFLRSVENGEDIKLGRKVAIYGGGNTAMDAARTAKRL